MNDTPVTNWDISIQEYSPEYFRDWAERILDAHKEYTERVNKLPETHEYTQVWLMSKKGCESLPDNPIWSDMIMAGGQFMGYQWVKKDER